MLNFTLCTLLVRAPDCYFMFFCQKYHSVKGKMVEFLQTLLIINLLKQKYQNTKQVEKNNLKISKHRARACFNLSAVYSR